MKRYLLAAIVSMLLFCAAGSGNQRKVMDKYFKECFDKRIGATEGAFCRFEEDTKEWHITYWGNGFGDCPAGCIHKDLFASYVVDKDGNIYSSAHDYTARKKIKPEEISKGAANEKIMATPPDVNPDNQLGCLKTGDCFWYQCCSTRPMSKVYREKHWKDVFLSKPNDEHCVMECEHAAVPKDQKLACVAFQCTAVAKDFPEVDPARPVVWIGTVRALPQCEEQYIKDIFLFNPTIIKKAREPGVAAGPKFSKWAADIEKQLTDKNPNKFTCKACDICYHINREYLLIFADDLSKFPASEWQRVDQ